MRCLRLLIAAALLALAPPAAAAVAALSPQPDDGALKDGLAVRYYVSVFRTILDFTDHMRSVKGKAGPPIPELNYKVGIGKVLTSKENDFVGAHITGLINFEQAGTHHLEVTSNDGVEVTLGGQMIFSDPGVHSDSTSQPIPVEVAAPGWHALKVLYFEKQSTSTLILKWRPPGAAGFEVVPAKALKHLAAP
jgi:hypothetical protein